jgi:CarD family transcriptional regulator
MSWMKRGGLFDMMFEVGDAVVHPVRGAGVVTDIEELQRDGGNQVYYRIKLLSQVRTTLMLPVKDAAVRGLRRAVQRSKLGRVWRALLAKPKRLPADYEKRYEVLDEKLQSGDLFQIAEVVRDLTGRLREQESPTAGDRQKYRKGIKLLAAEIAAARDDDPAHVEAQVRARLWGYGDSETDRPWQKERVAQYSH